MRRLLALVTGLALVAAGVGLLGLYAVGWTSDARATASAQERLLDEVPTSSAPAPAARAGVPVMRGVDVGEALAVMRIPRFGDDWEWAVVEGTDLPQIDQGPGHYPWTALPGEKGNTGFAAHRAGHGDPFLDFDDLRVGDEVVLEQGGVRWTYELTTAPEIIEATEAEVLEPRPGRAITLTTCWPKWGSEKRMVVHGVLADTDSTT